MLGKLRFPIAGSRTALVLLLSIICWGLAFSTAAYAAEVTTDTTEYQPGDTTIIDGFTFWDNEAVTLQITSLDGTPLGGEPGEPWDVLSGSLGDFHASWRVPYDNISVSLLGIARGQESGDTATTTFLAPKTILNQLQNGTTTSSPEWANGNINGSNSCYSEGKSVPYRYFVKKLYGGTGHYYTIQMEWTKGGIHALDYLTNYDATEDSAITLAGGFSFRRRRGFPFRRPVAAPRLTRCRCRIPQIRTITPGQFRLTSSARSTLGLYLMGLDI